jgi:hypothetical protein
MMTLFTYSIGSLWVTLEGDPDDPIQTRNHTLLISFPGKVNVARRGIHDCIRNPAARAS